MHPCQQLKNLYNKLIGQQTELNRFLQSAQKRTNRKGFIKQGNALAAKIVEAKTVPQIYETIKQFFGMDISIRRRLQKIKDELDLHPGLNFRVANEKVTPYCTGVVSFHDPVILEDLCAMITHQQSPISNLDLSNRSLNNIDIHLLLTSLKNPNNKIKELKLSHNSIGVSGSIFIADTLENPNNRLETLLLEDNNIESEGAKLIFAALNSSNCKLLSLNLEDNGIGDDAVDAITEALSNPETKIDLIQIQRNLFSPLIKQKLAALNERADSHSTIYL